MPSTAPLPNVDDYLLAYGNAVRGEKDKDADVRRGSIYDHFAGSAAVLWSREAQRDRDMWRSNYFDFAEGDDLSYLIQIRYGVSRILDAYGTGVAQLTRPNATAGQGTIYDGTRIFVTTSQGDANIYKVSQDTSVAVNQLTVTVPIQATAYGTGQAINASIAQTPMRVDDPLWDTGWVPQVVICGDGTNFEDANAYRARAKATRLLTRPGRYDSIIRACNGIGAQHVIAFESYWGIDLTNVATSFGVTNDYGINACYVSDAGFNTSQALINGSQVACESARVCGAGMVFGGFSQSAIQVIISVALTDIPGKFDTATITHAIQGGLVQYFSGRTKGFYYKIDQMGALIRSLSPAIQNVTFITPTSDVTIVAGQWPQTLTRYTLAVKDIVVAFTGPV